MRRSTRSPNSACLARCAPWCRARPPQGRPPHLARDQRAARPGGTRLACASRLADRAEVRVGPAAERLAELEREAPFDLVFIDADKPGYPTYLDWALRLTRPGSIIVADNCIRGGAPLADEVADDPYLRGLAEYDRRVANDHGCSRSPCRSTRAEWMASPSRSCARPPRPSPLPGNMRSPTLSACDNCHRVQPFVMSALDAGDGCAYAFAQLVRTPVWGIARSAYRAWPRLGAAAP